jgi:hypothetical protein
VSERVPKEKPRDNNPEMVCEGKCVAGGEACADLDELSRLDTHRVAFDEAVVKRQGFPPHRQLFHQAQYFTDELQLRNQIFS